MSNGMKALAAVGLAAALHLAASRQVPAAKTARSRAARSRPAGRRIVVIADPHIDRKPGYRFGRTKPNPGFKRAIEQINAVRPVPAEVVILGDLARAGREDDYRKYVELLSALKAGPVRHLLGNHDQYEPFRKVVLKARATTAPATQPAPRHYYAWDFGARWRLIALDSRWKRRSGRVTDEQIEWFGAQVKAAKRRNVLVFIHHDPTRRGILGITNSKAFLAAVDRHPNIRAVMFGHRHEMEFTTGEKGVHFISAPPTAWIFKPRRPRGWLLVTPAAKSLTVEYVPLTDKHPVRPLTKTLTWE